MALALAASTKGAISTKPISRQLRPERLILSGPSFIFLSQFLLREYVNGFELPRLKEANILVTIRN